MRLIRVCPLVVLLLLLNSATAFAQSSAAQSFSRLKTLVGSWSGERSDGTPVQVSFRSTGAGSALVSELIAGHGNSEDMISVFHLDGEILLVIGDGTFPSERVLLYRDALAKSAADASPSASP